MKRFFTLLIIGILALSGISSAQAQCARIARDTTVLTGTVTLTFYSYYIYNSNNKLICIERRLPNLTLFACDSIYYGTVSGKVDSLIRYNKPSGTKSGDFLKNTWTGNNLTRQVNHYFLLTTLNKDTSTYTYTGANLTSFTQKRFDGSSTTLNTANSIVSAGGNYVSGNLSFDGSPSAASTISFDSYTNPFYNLPIFNDPLIWGCQNNVTTAFVTALPPPTLPAFFTYSLTYYGTINQLATTNRPYNQVTASIRYAWDCQLTPILGSSTTEEVGFAPNPAADGIFKLENSKGESYDEIVVSSVDGKIVFSKNNVNDSEIIIDLSSAKPGLYVATLKNSNAIKVARLVK